MKLCRQVPSMGNSIAVWLLAPLAVGMFACSGPSVPPENRETAKPAVVYNVIEEWSIPNGGYGRAIVVDPAQRSEAGLLALTDQLRQDTKADRNAFVFIYDNSGAAKLRKAAFEARLSTRDMKLHDDHMIGTYVRNSNTGFHAITIALQGAAGPMKEIPLR